MNSTVFTLSNGLSALRLILSYPVALLLLNGGGESGRQWLFALIAIAILSDYLDGLAARRLNTITELGKILDPLADKVMIATISYILMLRSVVPVWFVAAVLARDVVILAGGLYLRRRSGSVIQSTAIGKWTVTTIAAFLIAALVSEGNTVATQSLLAASTLMLLLSSIFYGRRFVLLLNAPAHAHQSDGQ